VALEAAGQADPVEEMVHQRHRAEDLAGELEGP
jgi:hypothetical protein